jgi:prefoldin subunit 5
VNQAPVTLPPLPAPPTGLGLILFSPAAWHWIVQAFQALHAADQAQFTVLGQLTQALETVMATVEELQAALDKNTADTAAAGAAIAAELAQLAAAIAALSTGAPPTQAQIDQLNASSAALEAATASLVADDPAAPPAP